MRLATACYGSGVVTVFYSNEQMDKIFVVGILNIDLQSLKPPTGTPIQLGNLIGYASDEKQRPDLGRFYGVSFEKRGWLYSVYAGFDKIGDRPANKVTRDEVNAVALSMAER